MGVSAGARSGGQGRHASKMPGRAEEGRAQGAGAGTRTEGREGRKVIGSVDLRGGTAVVAIALFGAVARLLAGAREAHEVLLRVRAHLCGVARANEGRDGLDVFVAKLLDSVQKALVLIVCPVPRLVGL